MTYFKLKVRNLALLCTEYDSR